jgi:two-component system, chemotaxis family, protein-glutamate methylesterase/glutaminase
MLASSPVRVLLAEPSLFLRQRLVAALGTQPDIQIVADCGDGRAVLTHHAQEPPDVFVLAAGLGLVDGLQVLVQIMRERPRPVIIMGQGTDEASPLAVTALELGAVAFVRKDARAMLDHAELAADLAHEIRRAARVRVVRSAAPPLPVRPPAPAPVASALATLSKPAVPVLGPTAPPRPSDEAGRGFPVVAIGSSTGGPATLLFMAKIWGARPLPAMLVAQHLPAGFTAELARQWAELTPATEVREARGGDVPRPGLVLICPGGCHMELDTFGRVRIAPAVAADGRGPWVPSADRLLRGVAAAFGPRARAFVLSGMGDDGMQGVRVIVGAGGAAWAQDAPSCAVDGMPAAARATGLVQTRTPAQLAALIADFAAPALAAFPAVAVRPALEAFV